MYSLRPGSITGRYRIDSSQILHLTITCGGHCWSIPRLARRKTLYAIYVKNFYIYGICYRKSRGKRRQTPRNLLGKVQAARTKGWVVGSLKFPCFIFFSMHWNRISSVCINFSQKLSPDLRESNWLQSCNAK